MSTIQELAHGRDAELRRLEAENTALKVANEHLNNLAQTAEKWQGIAIARGGDGRTVNQLVGPLNERIEALIADKAELLEALKRLRSADSTTELVLAIQSADDAIAKHGG